MWFNQFQNALQICLQRLNDLIHKFRVELLDSIISSEIDQVKTTLFCRQCMPLTTVWNKSAINIVVNVINCTGKSITFEFVMQNIKNSHEISSLTF